MKGHSFNVWTNFADIAFVAHMTRTHSVICHLGDSVLIRPVGLIKWQLITKLNADQRFFRTATRQTHSLCCHSCAVHSTILCSHSLYVPKWDLAIDSTPELKKENVYNKHSETTKTSSKGKTKPINQKRGALRLRNAKRAMKCTRKMKEDEANWETRWPLGLSKIQSVASNPKGSNN